MEASSGIALDTAQNRILFIGKHKIITYDIVTSEMTVQKVNNVKPSVTKSESYYYSNKSHKIFCIGTIPNEVNVYDENKNEWLKGSAGSAVSQSVNSTFFLNDLSGDTYSLGGVSQLQV